MSTASARPSTPTRTPSARSLFEQRAVWVWTGAAVVAVVLGALATQAYAPTLLEDPGPVVLWSLPLATALTYLAGSATVGFLGVAAFGIPKGRGRRNTSDADARNRALALRWANYSAIVWALATVVVLLTTFADIAGLHLTDPEYVDQFLTYVFPLEVTRVLAISLGLVLVVITGTLSATQRPAIIWLLAFALVAELVLALNGHAAGSADHESAVNALGIHILGLTVWTGGLLALIALRARLGEGLGLAVARFSRLATWAYAAVVFSGIQQSAIRLGNLAGLQTRYGMLVLVKVTLTVALGVLGWQQRKVLAARLLGNPYDGRAFRRWAVTELALMGAAAGVAVVLARSVPPVPDSEPNPSRILALTGYPDPGPMGQWDWFTAWRPNWFFLALALVLMGLYAAGVVHLHRRGDRWPWGRTASWMLGWLLLIYATNGAPDIWGRLLFSTHMLMHMIVAMIVPLFLVPGAPLTLALRALQPRHDHSWGPRELLVAVAHSRVMHWLANPVIAASLFFFSLAAFYWTGLFELALTTHTGHMLMMGHFLATGYLFTWVLIGIDPGPPRWNPLMLLVVLFATISFHAFFGVALTSANELLAANFFELIHAPWMPDAFADQHTAGEIAWGIGEVPTLILAVLVARNWVRSDDHDSKRLDRQADRDGDAELAAYNKFLGGLRNDPNADR